MIPALHRLEKTCTACPAQWEGELSDGTCFYVRYRFGVLRVGFGATPDAAVDDARFEWELGDGLDGWMEWDQASDYFDRAVRAQYAGGD
ncbi:MAG: hypothetical protein IPK75_07095 [Acidobacteria bacterium]|jgi:hypothetical protein|nr:hypothetical protein [Acidobacteriota bacterium]